MRLVQNLSLCLMLLLPLAACQPNAEARATMTNPASVNCTDHGGKLVLRQSSAGTKGYCMLQDGRSLDIWEYFRQTHA